MKVNSLWPSDAIWQQRSRSTLDKLMTCCLTPLSYCWLFINVLLRYPPESNFAQITILYNKLEYQTVEITATSPRSQCVCHSIDNWIRSSNILMCNRHLENISPQCHDVSELLCIFTFEANTFNIISHPFCVHRPIYCRLSLMVVILSNCVFKTTTGIRFFLVSL